MTAAELAAHRNGPALVAYLGQPDASAGVCDLSLPGPHLAKLDREVSKDLAEALREGRIPPAVWGSCASALLRSAPHQDSSALLDEVLSTYSDLITDDHFEADAALQARLAVLHQLYLERDPAIAARESAVRDLGAMLRTAIGKKRLGPAALKNGTELLATLDLEQGIFQGRTVDVPLLDSMLKSGDEASLLRCAQRLPDAALRTEAKRRVIQLHIQASPLPEVRANASALEERMMGGTNPVSLGEHPAVRAFVDLARSAQRSIVVEQDVLHRAGRLLGSASGRPGLSVLPEIPLSGVLQVTVEGISKPLTLCRPASELDPTPCLRASDVMLGTPLAYLDGRCTLRFVENIAQPTVVGLAQQGPRLAVPISVGDRQLGQIDWDLYFERPADLVFTGHGSGARGPDLAVTVDRSDARRAIYTASDGQNRYQAVIEWIDAPAFRVVSRGAAGNDGSAGFPGADGTPGVSGFSASCPSMPGGPGGRGNDGSRGGAGGDGRNGGPGGAVRVTVKGVMRDAGATIDLLRSTVLSEGGRGGRGGPGGRGGGGGIGGSGGMGSTCVDRDGHVSFVPGGSDGLRGSDGPRGTDGFDGRSGRPGQVTIVYESTTAAAGR